MAGKDGYKITRVTTTNIAGQVWTNSDVLEEVAPTTEVIEVGTKEDIRYDMRVERETLNYNTITRETKDLFKGESRVVSEGEVGQKATTYKDIYIDGVKVGTEVVGEPVVRAAKDRIVEIGTKDEKTITSITMTETVEFKSETVNDPNLEAGKTEVRTKGVNGSRTVVVTTTTDNRTGEQTVRREVTSETAATNEVVAVGTKQAVTTTETKTKVTLEEFLAMSEDEQDAFVARGGKLSSTRTTRYGDQAEGDLIETVVNVEKLNQESS